MAWQRLLAFALAPYCAWLVFPYEYHFLDGVNLAFHEAVHLFLGFGSESSTSSAARSASSSFTLAAALHFRARGDSFAPAVCMLWLGESGMNVAVYLGDASAQALPLVGGHVHDWGWLLGRAGLLAHCEALARALHLAASALVIAAWLHAVRAAFSAGSRTREAAA